MTKRNEIESRDRRKKTCAVRSVSTIVSFFGTIFFWKYPNVLFCFFLLSCSPWNEKKRPKKEEMNHFGWRKKETRKRQWNKQHKRNLNGVLVVVVQEEGATDSELPVLATITNTHHTHRSKARETCGSLLSCCSCCSCPGDPGLAAHIPSQDVFQSKAAKRATHTHTLILIGYARQDKRNLFK